MTDGEKNGGADSGLGALFVMGAIGLGGWLLSQRGKKTATNTAGTFNSSASSSQYWGDLTERQKYLDRAIANLLEGKDNSEIPNIPVTRKNVNWIVRSIGAQPDEVSFVEQRMKLYVECNKTIKRTDRYAEHLEKYIDYLKDV